MSVLGTAPLLACLLASLAPPSEVGSKTDVPDAHGAPAVEAEAIAKRLETEGALVPAAEAWEIVLEQAADADTRGHAAFRAQKAYREAARTEGQQELLCEAQRIVIENLGRGDLEDDERHDFVGFREEIAVALSASNTTCGVAPVVPLLKVDAGEQGTSNPEPERLDTVRASPPSRSATAPTSASEERSRSQVAPKKIAGGVLLGAGAALLGVATYGIIVDHRAADAIVAFAPKNNTVGLTESEIAELRAEADRARLGSRLAIGAGVSAGAALITGVVLLALPPTRHPKERRAVALQPSLSPQHAGVGLRGSF